MFSSSRVCLHCQCISRSGSSTLLFGRRQLTKNVSISHLLGKKQHQERFLCDDKQQIAADKDDTIKDYVFPIDNIKAKEIGQTIQKNGFYVSSTTTDDQLRLLSTDTCKLIKEVCIPKLFSGEFDTGVYPDEWHWREGISRDDVTREICNGWKSNKIIASIILSKNMGRLVSNIMGWSSVRIAQDDIIWKPPLLPNKNNISKTVVGYHQDSKYISNQFLPRENNSITVWITLDDITKDMGCIEYAVGSHLWEETQEKSKTTPVMENEKDKDEVSQLSTLQQPSFHSSDSETYRKSILLLEQQHNINKRNSDSLNDNTNNASNINFQKISTLKEGYAIFHHQDVWHGSGPNLNEHNHRRTLVGHYLRGDVKFCSSTPKSTNSTPWGDTNYIYGRYKRYQCNDVDENFFPIIYSIYDDDDDDDICNEKSMRRQQSPIDKSRNDDAGGMLLRRTPWIDEYIRR